MMVLLSDDGEIDHVINLLENGENSRYILDRLAKDAQSLLHGPNFEMYDLNDVSDMGYILNEALGTLTSIEVAAVRFLQSILIAQDALPDDGKITSDELMQIDKMSRKFVAECFKHDALKLLPLAETGKRFTPRGKKPEALYRAVEEIYKMRGTSISSNDVIDELKILARTNHSIIQQVVDEDKEIHWLSSSGKEKTTKFSSFKAQLSTVKKRIIK